MKTVLFCGGLGTRIRNYHEKVPKPMVPLGNQPILWHLMKYYSAHGLKDFILCLGYGGNSIKEYFLDFKNRMDADIVMDRGDTRLVGESAVDWRIAMIDTGFHRNVGSRLWAVRDELRNEELFLANYADGLSDANIRNLIDEFRKSGKVASFLAVRPEIPYHVAEIEGDRRVRSLSAITDRDLWINGGFFIFRSTIFDYINDGEELVAEPFARLIAQDKLIAFKHTGFWRSMDTLKDRQVLEDILAQGVAPWQKSPVELAETY